MSRLVKLNLFTLFAALTASLGGVLFGYNSSAISGAILFLTEEFQFSKVDRALIISILLLGALVGSLLGGYLTDHIGRKKTLFITVAIFSIGTTILVLANTFSAFMWGRFILGIGVGIVSVAVPLYIAEISPSSYRGSLVSLNQLAITIGILLGYIIDYIYSHEANWQMMFAFAFIPTFLFLLGLLFIPETPSYLQGIGKRKKAQKVMHKITGRVLDKDISMEEKKERVKKEAFSTLFKSENIPPLVTGLGISIFQQITGINVIIYYAPTIFQMVGYPSAPSAIYATIGIGVVNVIMTIVAVLIIDKIGRRPLLITGLIGMSLSLFTLGISFFEREADIGIVSLISLMAYVSFFAISLGPVAWLIISEIFPLTIRGRAMGLAIFANWICNYLVSLTFLNLIAEVTPSGAFWLYTGICLFALWFVSYKVPETKNKTFEEIHRFWNKK